MNLQKMYSDFSNPAAFSGVNTFYKYVKQQFPTVKKVDIIKFLHKNDAYTVHFPKRQVKKFRRILLKGIRYQFNMDLVDLQAFAKENSGYKYILNIIDCFTKFVWSFKLKRKTGQILSKVFDKFFKKHRPQKLEIDLGKEFWNAQTMRVLEKYGIQYFTVYSDNKGAIIGKFFSVSNY